MKKTRDTISCARGEYKKRLSLVIDNYSHNSPNKHQTPKFNHTHNINLKETINRFPQSPFEVQTYIKRTQSLQQTSLQQNMSPKQKPQVMIPVNQLIKSKYYFQSKEEIKTQIIPKQNKYQRQQLGDITQEIQHINRFNNNIPQSPLKKLSSKKQKSQLQNSIKTIFQQLQKCKNTLINILGDKQILTEIPQKATKPKNIINSYILNRQPIITTRANHSSRRS